MIPARERLRENAQECASIIDRINSQEFHSSCGGVEGHARSNSADCNPNALCARATPRGAGIKPCPQETYTFPGEKIAGYIGFAALVAMTIVVVAYSPRVKAQAPVPTSEQLYIPPEINCDLWNGQLKAVQKNPQFRKPIHIMGNLARDISVHVFGFAYPIDHLVLLPMSDGGTILLPCALGKSGPRWADDQANRIKRTEIDMDFVRKFIAGGKQ